MTKQLSWGIIGAGGIARAFAYGLTTCKYGRLRAIGSRSQEKADAFAEKWNVPASYGCYQDVLNDDTLDAVYIATLHPQHYEWTIKAAEAGKHILCEKPMAINRQQTEAMLDAAQSHGVLCMEAFMYRCHPQIQTLRELLRQKTIGDVRLIEASFGFGGGSGPVKNPDSRAMNPNHGGGGILDVGCYPVSIARLVAGEALGKRFADPVSVKAAGHIGETGVDEYAAALLRFDNDILAQVATGVRLTLPNTVTIYGSDGRIHLPDPWTPGGRKGCGLATITVQKNGRTETIDCQAAMTLYGLEADAVAEALPNQEVDHMSWDDTRGNMAVLDAWRKDIGLTYPMECE